jgi:uncharacterized protein DUF3179
MSTDAARHQVDKKGRWLLWLLLILFVLASFVFVLTPALLIQPFRPQTTRALEVSYLLKSWSPLITSIALLVILALTVFLWQGAKRWWRKAVLVVLSLLAFPPAWFARQNHFEWMFNPLRNSAYARAADADFVETTDMVLSVTVGNEAVAYPVRLMAYHHLVQDIVGGVPLVATY